MANEPSDTGIVADDEVTPSVNGGQDEILGAEAQGSENVLTYITAVSQITPQVCARYIRLGDPDVDDLAELGSMCEAAKAFAKKYTGVSDLDESPDFVLCVLILVQDQWDNRALYIEKGSLNRTVESILDLHSVNLL